MRMTLRVALALGMLVALTGSTAHAQFNVTAAYSVPPNSTLVPGITVTYTATLQNPPGMILGYNWQWMESDRADNGNVCNSNWKSFTTNNAASISVVEPWSGVFLVKCTVTYRVGMGGNQQTIDSNTVTITIPKPDGFKDPTNLNTPVAIGSTGTYVFPVTCGGVTCGPTGTAQEMIINRYLPFEAPANQHPPDDTAWTPAAPSPVFYLAAGGITDIKGTYEFSNWSLIPNNTVFMTFTQRMQIIASDACGNTNAYDLGSINLQRRKVNATQWQLEKQ